MAMIRSAMSRVPLVETPRVKSWHSLTAFRRPPTPEPSVENAAPNNTRPDIGRRWPLRQRLLLIITLALLPVAFINVLEGVERVRRDNDDIRTSLLQSARATADEEQSLLDSGEQILRAVGSLKDVRNISENCG